MKHCLLRILAAFVFFTRLPFWRLADVPKPYFARVVPLWPLVGWLTGGMMMVVCWGASFVFPAQVCVVLALLARLLVTGALHEDGFADFCDGFGGGGTRQRTLDIMKDPHIGTYGVLGLVFYYALLFGVLAGIVQASAVPSNHVAFYAFPYAVLVSGDAFAKWASSNIVNALPYARSEEEAKNKLVYAKMTKTEQTLGILFGLVPTVLLLELRFYVAMAVSFVAAMCVIGMASRRLHGYTGDCCGATFVVSELAYYAAVYVTMSIARLLG